MHERADSCAGDGFASLGCGRLRWLLQVVGDVKSIERSMNQVNTQVDLSSRATMKLDGDRFDEVSAACSSS